MIKRFFDKLSRTRKRKEFKEYGHVVKSFEIEEFGVVQYAQWLHPFESEKFLTSETIAFYKAIAPEGSMIIDIGAHTGDTTVPMALAVGDKGLVIGLEPNKYVFKVLEKNSQLNIGKSNIIPLNFAATEHDGEFTFNYSDASFCNGGFLQEIENNRHRHNYELKVVGRNLERYLREHHKNDLHRLSLLKIDAEGYDNKILQSMSSLVAEYKPVLIVECYKKLTQEERYALFDTISGLGYSLFYKDEFEESRQKLPIGRNDMSSRAHFDIIAFPG